VESTASSESFNHEHFLSDHRIQDIRQRLESIAEELGDVSFDLLREAVAEGASKRPPQDKILAQARRAVDKAARLLADD